MHFAVTADEVGNYSPGMATPIHCFLSRPARWKRSGRLRGSSAVTAICLLSCSAVSAAPTVGPLVIEEHQSAAPGGSRDAHGPLPADLDKTLRLQLQKLALDSSRQAIPGVNSVEIEVGRLDPRLKLAPCERVEPYLPPATRLWGKARIGLRCTQGPTPWNVYLPITVKVFGTAWVAASSLAQGSMIGAGDLLQAEIDLAEDASPIINDPSQAAGRYLQRAIHAGQPVRTADVRPRQWFAAGDVVKVVAQGPGFSISASGEAMAHGIEGRPVRVRTEAGKIISGFAAGDRRVEVRP